MLSRHPHLTVVTTITHASWTEGWLHITLKTRQCIEQESIDWLHWNPFLSMHAADVPQVVSCSTEDVVKRTA